MCTCDLNIQEAEVRGRIAVNSRPASAKEHDCLKINKYINKQLCNKNCLCKSVNKNKALGTELDDFS